MEFDQSELDRTVASMQRKIREIYAPLDAMRNQGQLSGRLQQIGVQPGSIAAPAKAEYERATQKAHRDALRMISEEARGINEIDKSIKSRIEKTQELKRLHGDLLKMGHNQEGLNKEILQSEKEITKELGQRAEKIRDLADAIDEYTKKGGGGGGGGGFGGRALQALGGVGGIGKILAVAGAGATALGSGINNIAGAPMRMEEARGTAIQQTLGQDLSRVYAGKSPFEANWMKERGQASAMAEKKESESRWGDRIKAIGALVLGAGGGALAGGAAGTAVPIVGNVVGAIGGGIAGATGAYMNMSDRSRYSLTDQGKYDQIMKSQRAQDFRSILDSLKEEDPRKKLGAEAFEQTYQRNLQIQRMLGINNRQFYAGGGLQQQATAAGFMPDQALDMAQGIVGAGGSARSGFRNATLGLQMQRQGLTNASSILGSLSGGIQDPEKNKRAVIGIMSEAFKIGLDDTEFAEENRRFTQAAAGIIGKVGATGESDQDRIAKALGMFLGERTNRGIEAAQGAYEKFQQRGSQLGGRRGQVRFAEASQNAVLGRIKRPDDLAELLGTRPENLTEDSPMIQALAKEAQVSPKQLIEEVQKVNSAARFQLPGSAKANQRYTQAITKYMQQEGINYAQLQERQRGGKLPQDISEAMGRQQLLISKEQGEGYSQYDVSAQQGEFYAGVGPEGPGKAGVEAALGKQTDRIEDTFLAEGAKGADDLRRSINELRAAMEGLTGQTDAFTHTITGASRSQQTGQAARREVEPQGDPVNKAILNTMNFIQVQGGSN